MKKKYIILTLFCCLLFIFSTQAQNIIYINASATGANNGSSWTDAYTDFQTGVKTANSGDSVFVAKGTYQPASGQSFSMKNGVKIYGGFAGTEASLSQRNLAAGNSSILKGNGNSVIYNNGINAAAVLDGFSITGGNGGNGGFGGGLYNSNSSPLLSHLIFVSNNAFGGGGGVCNVSSSPRFTNVIFASNTTSVNVNVYGDGGGMVNYYSSPKLTNVTFVNNQSSYGGGMFNNISSPSMVNCTFSGNTASSYGGGIFNSSASSTITNSIFWGNTATIGTDIYLSDADSTLTVNYSYTQTTQTGLGNITGSTSPFVNSSNPAGADGIFGTVDDGLKLIAGSAAINTGDPQTNSTSYAVQAGTTDITGLDRILNDRIDMGAYEKQTTIYVNSTNVSGIHNGLSWATAFTDFQLGVDAASAGDSVFVARGTYQPASGQSFSMKEGVKIYGGFAGTETSLSQRDLKKGDTSFLKGNGNTVIYNNNNGLTVAALLDNFTITSGNADNGGGMFNSSSSPTITNCIFSGNSANYGGGMYNSESSPTITNCIFSESTATWGGGGMFNLQSSSILTNCTFSENTANRGGGIYKSSSSSSIITNCIFSGNTASGGGRGGGMYNSDLSSTVINCIFSGNTASMGGGMYNDNFSSLILNLTNCTFSGNTATLGGGMVNDNEDSPNPGIISITNCIIYDNNSGIVNIRGLGSPISLIVTYSLVQGMDADATNHNLDGNTDPLFVNAPSYTTAPFTGGDYILQTGSPAINVGNNATLAAGDTTDLAGNPRIAGSTVDMGAYEFQSALPITLENFTATKESDYAKLEWTTASEINNKEFIISRSSDGSVFTEIGKVAGAGTTFLEKNYTFYDNDPANGINYYRLQQVDIDGRITEAGIRTVRFSFVNGLIKIYPNPTENEVRIEFGEGSFRQLELTDNTGKVLQRITLGINDREKILQLGNYPAGIYMIRLTGEKVASEKVVKE
jgi:hypothetical protein